MASNCKRTLHMLSHTRASPQDKVFKLRKLRWVIMTLLTTYSQPEIYADPVLPMPCGGGPCGIKAMNTSFVEVGTIGNGSAPLVIGSKMYIQQLSNQAILNWASFNLSHDASVIFNQPSATAAVLNRIWSADPSVIAGKISANGQVYLVNTNGIVFANGAQVDTGALLASTLNVTNDLFLNGILSDNTGTVIPAAFRAENGLAGNITVENSAVLNSASGGRIFLFAPQITNNGSISTPDGQTILAAGKQVYLAASSDPAMRGLLVQVNADALAANGTITNNGTITAERGNVTLAGLMVNQRGTARATTSVNANGSIYLQAGDVSKSTTIPGTPDQFFTTGGVNNKNGVALSLPGKGLLMPTVGGTLTLGAGSKTEVLLDSSDEATITDKQVFQQSNIGMVGKNIILEGKTNTLAGAQVKANAGLVTALAAEDPYQSKVNDNNLAETPRDSSRIYIGEGAKVDVSGVKDVKLQRRLLQVELRSSQLADAPLLRNGFLQGKTLLVDPSLGTTLTDITPDLQNIGRGIEEKSTMAGSIRLDSRGDVITRNGSVLDMSGGSIQYAQTNASTTKLLGANGVVYDVTTASKDIQYVGFANTYKHTDERYGITTTISDGQTLPGYIEGKSAGNLSVLAGSAYLRGDMLANTVTGVYQRQANSLPEGGHFSLGDKAMLNSPEAIKDMRIGNVQFVNAASDTLGNFDALHDSLSPSDVNTTVLATRQLIGQGFNHLDIYSNGVVTVPAATPITLNGKGSFAVTASAVNIDSAIVASGGKVSLSAKANLKAPQVVAHDIHLSGNAVISTAGLWVNDSVLAPQAATRSPIVIDGGTVSLSAANDVTLDQGSVVDVSGGGWLDSSVKSLATKTSSAQSFGVKANINQLTYTKLTPSQKVAAALTANKSAASKSSTGQSSNGFTAGKSGDITLEANADQLLGASASIGKVSLGGSLRGDSFDQAGTLSITSGYLTIGDHALNKPGELWLTSGFFNQGFAAYDLIGIDGVTVLENTTIAPRQNNLVLNRNAISISTGADIANVASVMLLPEVQRHAADIALSSTHYAPVLTNQFGNVLLTQGASISTDAGAKVALTARENLTVLGNIDAPAGDIKLEIAKGVKAGDQESDQGGYRADQQLLIGASSIITAQGKVMRDPVTASGVRTGKVLDAGTISLLANKGSVVTEAGSTLDVSGKSANFDINYKGLLSGSVTSAGKAGEIDIHAHESLVLKGNLAGNAANVAAAQAGSLTIGLDNYDRNTNPNASPIFGAAPYPTNDRVLTITSDTALANTSSMQAGVAVVNADTIRRGNFDNVTLKSSDVIAFNGNVDLSNRQSIQIDAPVIRGDANTSAVLNSSYVAIGNADRSKQVAGSDTRAPATGNAALTVQANLIDVQNKSTFSGFDQLSLKSAGDIRFDVSPEIVNQKADFKGSLKTSADILLQAAQIYPTTRSQFTINPNAIGNYSVGNITIMPNGTSKVPLSAGGSLVMNATNITQNGTLRAPIGNIQLNASNTLELGAGSLTSVSAEGLNIPYGFTQNGQEWLYGVLFSQDKVVQSEIVTAPPVKEVSISAPTIIQKSGATVDISGGGDLYAYEFIAGTGGSKDVLSLGSNEYTAAIVPSLGNAYAPVDHQYAAGSELKVGASVYLTGVPGLKDGYYTLLPARYALLDGAYAVKVIQPNSSLALGTTFKQADGSLWVAAKNAVSNTGIRDSLTSTLQLTPGSVVRTQSQYLENTADAFYSKQALANGTVKPRTPKDAGQFVAAAIDKLVLDGVFKTAAANQGRGADIAILSNSIRVVDSVGADDGTLQLTTSTLNNLHAESLLLGAKRATTAQGDQLTVTASSVEVDNDKANPLKARELILAAKDTVTVKAGSGIQASTSAGSSDLPANDLLVDGDGALLRLSAGEQVLVKRQNVAGATGLLDIQSATLIDAGTGSLNLDATLNTNITGTSTVKATAINIASGKISIGDAPTNTTGLLLTEDLLGRLEGLKNLGLHSYTSLNLYDNAILGSASNPLSSVVIDASAILGFGNTDKAINAGQLTLLNTNGTPVVDTGTGSGSLTINVQQAQSSGRLIAGNGNKTLQGFGQVAVNVAQDIIGQGSGSLTLNNAGDLTLSTSRLGMAAGADLDITNQTGDISLLRPGTTIMANASQVGGKLSVTGNAVTINSLIELPGGTVALNAKTGDVTIGTQGVVQANGFSKTFGNTATAYGNAGNIALNSDQGNVVIQAGGKLDVSAAGNGAGTQGGKAGKVSIAAANGVLDNQGSILGTPKAGNSGASFSLDASTINNLSTLNTQLAQGGFSGDLALRARGGDLTLASNDVVKAGSVTLTADGGNVQLDGKIDTTQTTQGNIAVWAKDNVTLTNGAKVSTVGGDVTFGSQSGTLDLQSGAEVSLKGTSSVKDGQLTLRAARTANNSDIKINAIGASIDSGRKVIVEGVKTYQQVTPDFTSTAAGSIRTETSNFANNASAISARLLTDPSKVQVRAGVEVDSSGEMNVNSNLNLRGIASLRVNDVPINLTLRAGGDLVVNASISDGFASAGTTAIQALGDSASYRFTAGADFNSANPLATVSADASSGSGNFVLTPNNLIRTGNGNIDVAAANDIRLGYSPGSQDYSDANAQKSVIYTAGVPPSTALNDFSIPLRVTGRQALEATYPTDGGNITLHAGNDVRSAETDQFISNWLWRRGRLSADGQTFDTSGFGVNRRGLNTTWWVAYDQFQQGIGALGGGNISINAGHDVVNVSAVIPTSGRIAAALGVAPTEADIYITGGGNLNVTAGNDIKSGLFEADKGIANLTAYGAFGYERIGVDGTPLYPILAYADTQINANARTDLNITTLVNSTMVPQANTNKLVSPSYFYTVGANSALNVSSTGGNVNLPTAVDPIKQTILDNKFESITQSNNWTVYPTILDVTAFSANASVSGRLFPSATGNLQVRAANDVFVPNTITMLESSPLRAGVLFPTQSGNSDDILLDLVKPLIPLHLNDTSQAYVIADKGNISGNLFMAKPLSVLAGNDIRGLNLVAKNLKNSDITTITAGNDIVYSVTRNELSNDITSNTDGISIEGPGLLAVAAGGEIDLGNSAGIISRGNLADPRLAAKGASLLVSAGLGNNADGSLRDPNYQAFIDKYLASADSIYQGLIKDYVREFKDIQTPELADTKAEYDLRRAEFLALDRQAQLPLIAKVLYEELRTTGLDHNLKGFSYDRGYQAIDTLYPEQLNNQPLPYAGGINLAFSQIKTEQGGDISLLVPGGGVTVGYANPPAELNAAKRNGDIPAEANLGLLALSEGAIRAFARDSFLVNQSRILTLQGGAILLWTSLGDIDAGKGAKTVSAAPPPVIQTDSSGNVFVNPSGAVSGSGIGQLLTKPGVIPSPVDILAPKGDVNAGDAGIRFKGPGNIVGNVIGAGNIKAEGSVTGVPISSIGAGVSALASASAVGDTNKALGDKLSGGLGNNLIPDATQNLLPSILSFRLLGLGNFNW